MRNSTLSVVSEKTEQVLLSGDNDILNILVVIFYTTTLATLGRTSLMTLLIEREYNQRFHDLAEKEK